MKERYVRIGAYKPTTKKVIYLLVIEDYIQILDPPKSMNLPKFNPHNYFITSGDAICKAKILSRDLWQYAGKARRLLNNMKFKRKTIKQFEKKCWESAGGATAMINALKMARGEAIFMETEWCHHALTCRPKNPKIKSAMMRKEKSNKINVQKPQNNK